MPREFLPASAPQPDARMQRGNLECGVITPQDYAALIPEYSIFTTGYIYRDAAHLDAVFDGDIGTEYKARIAKDIGVQILRSQYFGARHVILRQARDVKTPADLAGLKLRMPAAESWLFLGNALGGNATPLAFEEIYLALQTGTIDGLENPLPDAMASKFYEVTEQVVLTGHLIASNFVTVAGKFWDGLSPELRTAVEKAEAAGKKLSDEGVAATEKDAKAFFESKGVKVTTPDVAVFRDQVQKKFVESDFAKAWPTGMKRLLCRGVGLGVALFYEFLDPGLQHLGPRLWLFIFWNVVFIVYPHNSTLLHAANLARL